MQLEGALIGQIWDNLNIKINNDSNRLLPIEQDGTHDFILI